MRKIAIVTILCLVVLFSVGCKRLTTEDTFSVSGAVMHGTEALSNVEILINSKAQTPAVFTDDNGSFSLSALKTGDVLSFKKEGYSISDYTVKSSVSGLNIVALKLFKITATATVGGTVSGGATYKEGEIFALSATPDLGYTFINYTLNDEIVGTTPDLEITAVRDATYTAVFSPIVYTVQISTVGTVTGGGSYNYGEEVTLSSEESPTLGFDGWYSGNELLSNALSYTFTATENISLEARFFDRVAPVVPTVTDNVLSFVAVEGADGYRIYADGVLKTTTYELSIPLSSILQLSGHYVLSVVAIGGGEVRDSAPASLTVDYYKPIDTPKNVGIFYENDKFYLGFSRVNAAADYFVTINDTAFTLSDYPLLTTYFDNSVKLDFSSLIDEATSYSLTVTAAAADNRHNSHASAPVEFYYYGALAKTSASHSGDVLSWTAVKDGATYTVIVDGVVAARGINLLSFNTDGLPVGNHTYEIRVSADGYFPSAIYGNINIT